MHERSNGQAHARNGHAGPSGTRSDGADAGRDPANGRFVKGNKASFGNPFARRAAALRQAFQDAVTPADMLALGRRLFAAALRGDWQAAKLVLLFVLGRPPAAVNPDDVDRDEWLRCQDWPQGPALTWLGKIPFAEAVAALQALAERARATVTKLGDHDAEA